MKSYSLLKSILFVPAIIFVIDLSAQSCYSISNRTNGNGNPGTCGTPSCSGNAKTGHIDVAFGAACPGVIPALQLISVSSGALPNPFCFDPGSCISPGTVRYCFRGTNLPSSGFMTVRLTQGAAVWNCTFDVNGGTGTILPVKLSAFDARVQQQQVVLKWTTEQEINNEAFQIERSDDGKNFTSIANVKGTGTSYTTTQYSYADMNPVKGVSYYRLKQVDFDGKFEYSTIARVDNRVSGIQLKQVYPNPASTSINLQLSVDEPSKLDIRIVNLSGVQVSSATRMLNKGDHTWQLNLPTVATGVYKMIISSDMGAILTEKLLIN